MAGQCKEISDACANNEDLGHFTKKELQRYLAYHKQQVSGNKNDLVDRVKGTHKLEIRDVFTLAEIDKENRDRSEKERFTTPLGERVPKPTTLENWITNFSTVSLPDFTNKDIYNYIVLKMKSKKQLKSKVFFEDGHVHHIEVHMLDENTSHMYIRSSVMPSLPTADKKKSPDYTPWILISKITGQIHSAACDCPAGDGECCNHIGALLYAVRDIAEKQKDGKLSGTSQKCQWSIPAPRKRKLSPKKSQHVVFKKHNFDNSLRKPVSGINTANDRQQSSSANVNRFRDKLMKTGQNVGWLLNFHVVKNEDPVLPKLHNIEFMYADWKDLYGIDCVQVFNEYSENLVITPDECQIIETVTRGQNNAAWLEARRERLTASTFGRVVKRKPETKPDSLLKQIMYAGEFSSEFTTYGKRHEKVAKRMYIKHAKRTHKGLVVKESGLIVDRKQPHLGASPDGLVYCMHCKDHGHGLLEIKCPASMKWRMCTPEQCCKDKTFFCELTDGKVKLKRNSNYFIQVQGQMGVSGRQWCDFVVWTCVGLSVERIQFDVDFWQDMSEKLTDFYRKYFIPELFSRRVQRNRPLFQ